MSVTINNITVDFVANPPTVTFLQGADMDVLNIRDTLRQIELSDEGRMQEASPDLRGFIVKSSGRESFDATTTNALTVTILPPFVMQFQAGAAPFQTTNGNLLGTFVDSPGAIVQINNAVGSTFFNSPQIEYSSFNGGVTVDVVNGTAGTAYPIGTPTNPCDNITDAHTILATRGFTSFYIIGAITLDDGGTHPHVFKGEGMSHSRITVNANTNVHDADFTECMVIGTLSGGCEFHNGHMMNVIDFLGTAEDTMLEGTIALGGDADELHARTAHFLNCYSAVAGGNTPIIDMNGSGQALAMRNYSGGIKIVNKYGPEPISIDLVAGQVIIDDTVTGGEIHLRGSGKWTNKYTYAGTATVVDSLIDGNELHELHANQGLEPSNPVTITQTRRVTQDGSIDVAIGGDGVTQSTLTRQDAAPEPQVGVFSSDFSSDFA